MKIFCEFIFNIGWSVPPFEVTKTVTFSTQLNGGFSVASFSIPDEKISSSSRLSGILGAKCKLVNQYSDVLFEGQVTSTATIAGGLQVELTGLYERGSGYFFDMIYTASRASDNLVPNPSFEVNVTDGWSLSGGSRAQETGEALYGTACCKLSQAGSDLFFRTYIGGIVGEQPYTASVSAKDIDTDAHPSLIIEQYDVDDVLLTADSRSMNGFSKDAWTLIERPITTHPDVSYVAVGVRIASGSGSFLVDGFQFENLSTFSGYFDGDVGSGVWSGTPHNSYSSRPYISATVAQVVQDCISVVTEWANGGKALCLDATAYVDTQDFTDKRVKDAIDTVMKFGWREDNMMAAYFAIYEDGIGQIIPERGDTWVDWIVSDELLKDDSIQVSLSLDNTYNRVYAAMDNRDGAVKTLPVDDVLSIEDYGVREGMVQSGSNPEGIALASELRDMALQKYKTPRPTYSITVVGAVFDSAHNLDTVAKIRAGQTILINSMVLYFMNGETTITYNNGVSGFVIGTDYSGADDSVRLTFYADTQFETMMSRLGLSGGLS